MPTRRSLPFVVLPVVLALVLPALPPAPSHAREAASMDQRPAVSDGGSRRFVSGAGTRSTAAAVQPSYSVARAGAAEDAALIAPGPSSPVPAAPPVTSAAASPVAQPQPAPAQHAPVAEPAAGAAVVEPPQPAEDPWLRQRADEVVAMISYPWGELGYEAVFLHARAGMRGRTLRIERRIEIYVRPGDSATRTAFDLAHEIAHAFDFTYGSTFIREEWQRSRGLRGLPWYGCNACDDLGTPAGDFAESFAAWQVPAGDFSSRLAPRPDAVQQDLLARLTSV